MTFFGLVFWINNAASIQKFLLTYSSTIAHKPHNVVVDHPLCCEFYIAIGHSICCVVNFGDLLVSGPPSECVSYLGRNRKAEVLIILKDKLFALCPSVCVKAYCPPILCVHSNKLRKGLFTHFLRVLCVCVPPPNLLFSFVAWRRRPSSSIAFTTSRFCDIWRCPPLQ